MRVLILTASFLPVVGGAELAVHHLAEGLVALGQDVLVCTSTPKARTEHVHSYQVWRYPNPRGLNRIGVYEWWFAECLAWSVRRWRPSVVHCYALWPAGYCAVRNRKRIGVPVVLTSQGGDIQSRRDIGYGLRLQPRLDRRIRYAVQGADQLVAIEPNIRAEFINIGASPGRVAEMPNSIDCEALSSAAPEARRLLGLPVDRPIILAVGSNRPVKGFADLIRAMELVVERNANALCVIVGRGVPQLGSLVAGRGLVDHMRLFGEASPVGVSHDSNVSQPEGSIYWFFKAADVFVMPSILEGSPLALLEAMASGLPIVATRTAGAGAVLKDGVSGLLTPVGDASALAQRLGLLLGDERLRRAMAEAAHLAAAPYDRRSIAQRHVTLYQEMARVEKRS